MGCNATTSRQSEQEQRRWQTIEGSATREPVRMQYERATTAMTRVASGKAKYWVLGERKSDCWAVSAIEAIPPVL
jgi:hypothetical protein